MSYKDSILGLNLSEIRLGTYDFVIDYFLDKPVM